MAASRYCEPADLYRYAVARGSFPKPARLVADVQTATEILTLDGHGLEADEELTFRTEAGGTLPSPLVAGTSYFAIPLSDSTFQVAAAPGGTAINLTTAGSNIVMITELPFDQKIQAASAEVDDALVGHSVQLDAPYPETVKQYVATRAAELMLIHTGQSPGVLAAEMVVQREKLKGWIRGVLVRGPIAPPSANLAIKGTVAGTDPRGWGPADGTIP